MALNVQNCVDFWGSAPYPAEGAYDAPRQRASFLDV